MHRAIVALSNHSLETVKIATSLMQSYDVVILEEPVEETFLPMLESDITIDQYMMTSETEYPEFTASMCRNLRRLYLQGKVILQVEPYLERLLQIHDIFSDGGTPEQVQVNNHLRDVYLIEKKTSAALMVFYQKAVTADFQTILKAVKRFAYADSQRFILRDQLRAQALTPLLQKYEKVYIEAGQMHYGLWQRLYRSRAKSQKIQLKFLMADQVRSSKTYRHLYAPGDMLTLLFIFHPNRIHTMEDLLVAQALVYNKIAWKNEIVDPTGNFPLMNDELKSIAAVRQLSMNHCKILFDSIRNLKTTTARTFLMEYLSKNGLRNYNLGKYP